MHMTSVESQVEGSVGTRMSWAAILAGGLLALGLYLMLLLLGSAVGLSLSDRVKPTNLKFVAIAWSVLTLCASLFVGGVVTSYFTVGENKVEAMIYGILMWAVMVCVLIVLGAVGMRYGFNAMAAIAHRTSPDTWETLARDAGVPANQIDAWRSKLLTSENSETIDVQAMEEAATRITWVAFLGMWVSMMAAAAGAWLGTGSTFRVSEKGRTRVLSGPTSPVTN
jgi:hypothetical protein